MSSYCHILVKQTAKEMASTAYEERASHSDHFYKMWPTRGKFVKRMWPHFVETARHTLAELLNTNLDSALKDQIADALIKDNSMRRGRNFQIPPGSVRYH